MAKRKPAEYVHCPKCGYRGVDPNHDCTKVRAAIAAVVEQAARRPIEPVPPPANTIATDLDDPAEYVYEGGAGPVAVGMDHRRYLECVRLADVVSKLVGRPVWFDYDSGRITARQNCAACRGDITTAFAWPGAAKLFSALGAAARKPYLLHRCPPVETALVGFTYEELAQLKVELERDGTKMIERAAEIERLEKARVG